MVSISFRLNLHKGQNGFINDLNIPIKLLYAIAVSYFPGQRQHIILMFSLYYDLRHSVHPNVPFIVNWLSTVFIESQLLIESNGMLVITDYVQNGMSR